MICTILKIYYEGINKTQYPNLLRLQLSKFGVFFRFYSDFPDRVSRLMSSK